MRLAADCSIQKSNPQKMAAGRCYVQGNHEVGKVGKPG